MRLPAGPVSVWGAGSAAQRRDGRRVACALVALVLACSAAPVSGALAADASLAGHWPLDGSGADISGTGNTADLEAGTPFAPGRFADALDQRLDLKDVRVPAAAPGLAALEPARVTLSAWVNRSGDPGGSRFLVAKGGQEPCNAQNEANPSYALATDESGDLVFMTYDASFLSATRSPAKTGAAVFDGQWHSVVGVYDGVKTRLYVDGTQVGDGANGTGAIAYGLGQRALTVGSFPVASCPGHFPALIDDVRVYNRALGDADVAELARGETPVPPVGPPPVQPPVNTRRPAIAPEAGAAGTYRCDPGTWTGAEGDLRFAWRDTVRGTTAATTATFTPKPTDYGYTFLCVVTAANAGGENAALSDPVFFTSAGINTIPPPYGNLRVRGIDVYQTTQPLSAAQRFGFPSGAYPSLPGAGTPTSLRPTGIASILGSLRPQEAQYTGVTLDALQQTTAIVYVNTTTGPAGDPALPVQVTLTALRGGRQIGTTLTRSVTNPPSTSSLVVTPFERQRLGVAFDVPAEWLQGGKLDLRASVEFRPGELGASFGRRECDGACGEDNSFLLKGVPAEGLPQLVIGAIQMTRSGQGSLAAPSTVLGPTRRLLPGGARMVIGGYQATLDITTETALTGTAVTLPIPGNPVVWVCNGATYAPPNFTTIGQVNRACRISAVGARVVGWMATNPPRELSLTARGVRVRERYDILFAGHSYPTGAGTTEPGWQNNGDITGVSAVAPLGTGPFIAITTGLRPLTAAAHELGHALSAPHADQNCGGNSNGQVGEAWPPDNRGRLQGVQFRQPTLLGVLRRTPPQAVLDDPVFPLYDLMSYCATNTDSSYLSPADAWLGPYNWNRFFTRLREFGSRVSYTERPSEREIAVPGLGRGAAAGRGRARVAASAPSRLGLAVGTVGEGGGAITRVEPPDRERADVPAVDGSPVRLRSLGTGGRVLLDAGVRVNEAEDQPPGAPGTFAGPVDPRATALELVRDGTVVARLERGTAPKVTLRAPRAGTRLRASGAVSVRWSATGGGAGRSASVQFSADGGRTWRTVFDGPDAGAARVAGSQLTGSRDARLRVTVRSGLTQGRVVSGRLTADGRPPSVSITSPAPGQQVLAGDRVLLAGSGTSDAGTALRGRALRWFAGRRLLGSGERLRARLPAGVVTLRLVGRARRGASSGATLRVRVERRPLRILRLSFPRAVAARARTVTGTLAVSEAATLVSGSRRAAVGVKARKVTLPLPATPAHGLVRVAYTLRPRSADAAGVVRGVVEVVRP